MKPPRRLPSLGAVVVAVAALAGLAACGDDAAQTPAAPAAPAESDAVRLWRLSVWSPNEHSVEDALRAAEISLEAPDELPLDDAFVFTAATLTLGDVARGEPSVQVMRSRQPNRPGVVLLSGLLLSLRHDRQEALRLFEAAAMAITGRAAAEPFVPEVRFLTHLYRGQERYLVQDYARAIADLERAKAQFAERGEGVHRELVRFLADAHMNLQQLQPAEAILREALAEDPYHEAHHFQLGMVLAAQARSEEAAESFRACLDLTPDDPMPRLKLAELARRAEDAEGMRRELDRVRARVAEGELNGELSAGLGAYEMLVGGQSARAGDDTAAAAAYRRAREHLERAVEADHLCTRAYTLLVQVLALLDAPEAEIAEVKRRLEEVEHARSGVSGAADPFRTFC